MIAAAALISSRHSPRYRVPVAKVLITGMSGTGNSACLEGLSSRGFHSVDTDTDEWSVWSTQADGAPDWIWKEDAIDSLLDRYEKGHILSRAVRPIKASSILDSATLCSSLLPPR